MTGAEFTALARLEVVRYESVANVLGVHKRVAQDVVLDLELAGLLRLATPAEYVPTPRGRRRCVAGPTFVWAD